MYQEEGYGEYNKYGGDEKNDYAGNAFGGKHSN